MSKYFTLLVSQSVPAETEICVSVILEANKHIRIRMFTGSGVIPPDTSIKLVWDIDGAKELLWNLESGKDADNIIEIDKTKIDGIKKLGLCLDNGFAEALNMSAKAVGEEV